MSLAQMIASIATAVDTNSGSWVALRFFTFSAIILNLSGAFLSLVTIKMCSDVPVAAQQMVVKDRRASLRTTRYLVTPEDLNIPMGVASGKGFLSPTILGNHFLLLRCFGMSKWYKAVDRASSGVLVLACICTFAALTFWMFLNEPQATAGFTMIVGGSSATIVICAVMIAVFNQKWR
ncbi:hypothetical protein M408DRAFT_121521 [Serendipita vermifera MAFF 305830]|uniref:Uncharacterized protein n=1 Tax=Serendipita vermifera MAFF 305830 TaxID=933852 RepID=A0A0C3BAX2_SERVB|nr:hypothetical protein M408DRAFT_121521 [Serendipita vermifera MAFF 305830]